jgi:ketosteroid isomerase-like protein
MNKRSVIAGSLVLLLMVSGAAVQTAIASPAAQAVMAGEHQWLKSQQTNDSQLLAPLLDERVVETDDGQVFMGKMAVLANETSVTWSSAEYTDLKVLVFDRTAIAIGVFTGKGTKSGKTIDVRVRFTDTWMKIANGAWLCVASHASDIKA